MWGCKQKRYHQQTGNRNSRKTQSRWDQTSEDIRAKETSFLDTIIRHSPSQGCPRDYPSLELTNKKSKNWQEDSK